jgi:hypothetical protein
VWDIFISHASEDKDVLVRPLAERLRSLGLKVWYDEFTLSLGDSLRESIDYGLANSRFGIVVLSPHFLAKNWPKKELDGLFSRETEGEKVILPIWHNIDQAELSKHSPMMADRIAVSASKGLDTVVKEIMKVVDPYSAYLSNGKLGVAVNPRAISLSSGGWTTRSFLTVNNKVESPVFSVYVKITVRSDKVKASDLKIEPTLRSRLPEVSVGNLVNLGVDVIRANGLDAEENEVVFLIITLLEALESRTFVVENTKALETPEHKLLLEVHSFESEPPVVLRKPNTASYPLSFKEPVRVKSISMLMSRAS